MRPAQSVDQLGGDAHARTPLPHRAFKHIADAQFAADLLHVDRLALVGKARVAGDHEQPADARERGDDLLDHAVGEIFLLRVAAHIGERQHRDRGLVREGERWRFGRPHPRPPGQARGLRLTTRASLPRDPRVKPEEGRVREGAFRPDAVDAHRPRNILEYLLAHILEDEVEPARRIFLDACRDANAAQLSQTFEAGCDVDAIAKDVVALGNDVTLVDADAELDALIRRQRGISFGHCGLHLGRAAHRIDDADKLDQHAVAGGLDDTAVMPGDPGINNLGAERLEAAEGAFFVGLDQPRIAGDIGREDRREPTFDANWPGGLHRTSSVANDPIPSGPGRALSMRAGAPRSSSAAAGSAVRLFTFRCFRNTPSPGVEIYARLCYFVKS